MSQTTEITLHSGRTIRLRTLFQYGTYYGLLAGYPHRKCNEVRQRAAIQYAKSTPIGVSFEEPFLIVPAEEPIEVEESIRQRLPYEPAAMPTTTCIGEFNSGARNSVEDFSCLVMVWFQDEFAMPIAPEVVTQIQAIDWHTAANGGFW